MRIEDLLLARLAKNSHEPWRKVCRRALHLCLAERLVSRINLDKGELLRGWACDIDDPGMRNAAVAQCADFEDNCVDVTVSEMWHELNDAITAGGHYWLSKSGMKTRLRAILPFLMQDMATASVIAENPLPSLWRVVADLLASRAHAEIAPGMAIHEVRLHNQLLLAAYFMDCHLPEASFAERTLEKLSSSMTSIRGTLVRIVENLVAKGVADLPPPKSSRTGGLVLRCNGLSGLLRATARESLQIDVGNGLVHRIIAAHGAPETPPPVGSIARQELVVQGRDLIYRLYEHTLLAYMVLSCIEQLVRALASSMGLTVIKVSGRPVPLPDIISQLAISAPTFIPALTAVQDLYSKSGANLRNRIMHGGLLDVNSKRAEILLHVNDPVRFPSSQWYGRKEYAPENICQVCCEVLERLDHELAAAGILTPDDLHWADDLWLTSEEIDLGVHLANDFSKPFYGEAWRRRIRNYIAAVAPATEHFFSSGLYGWFGGPLPDGLVNLMTMVLIFEAVYRATVHLMGFDILQPSGGNHVQYKMIDKNQLASSPILDALVDPLSATDRPRARQVFQLSIKIRDAFSHGAFTTFTPAVARGAGHLMVKSIQGLVDAGIHALTRVAAYYRWQNVRQGEHGFAVDDWLIAERQVLAVVADSGNF